MIFDTKRGKKCHATGKVTPVHSEASWQRVQEIRPGKESDEGGYDESERSVREV
jgi:hypothetical protein